jgi:hypothetical protein
MAAAASSVAGPGVGTEDGLPAAVDVGAEEDIAQGGVRFIVACRNHLDAVV